MTEPLREAIDRNASSTEHLARSQDERNRKDAGRFKWLVGALVVLFLTSVVTFLYFQRRADENLATANAAIAAATLGFEQSQCYNEVQGHYIKQIGLLADSNGASLRGEPVDVARNRARVEDLRRASEFVDAIGRICYTKRPDKTPLDGDVNDDGVIDVHP